MKLNYTDGCVCTSLTVDGEETINIKEDKLKEIIKEMISYAWKTKNESLSYIVKMLIKETGDFKSLMFGNNPIFDEINTWRYTIDEKNYLVYISVPTDEFLLVCELICDYTKLVRQEKWDSSKHCNDKYLSIIKEMIDKLEEIADLQWIFCKIMEMVGKEKKPYRCGCCGDTVYSYNLEI